MELPQLGQSFDEYKAGSLSPATPPDPDFNPFDSDPFPDFPDQVASKGAGGGISGGTASGGFGGGAPYAHGGLSAGRQDHSMLFQPDPAVQDILIIQGKYILRKSPSGLMIVNIRRAWERVLYERALKALATGEHVTQTALFPVKVSVGVQQQLLFREHSEMLAGLGFDISPVGEDAVCIAGVPEGYSCEAGKVEQTVGDLLLILSDLGQALPEVMQQKTAAKFAMLGAVNASVPDTPLAAARLLDTLFSSDNPEFTFNGRRVVSVLPVDEIDKRF